MAQQSAGFVHEHIEKVVVLLCGAAVIGAIYFAFLSGRFATNDGKAPSELIAEIDRNTQNAQNAVVNARPPELSDDPPGGAAVGELLKWYGEDRKPITEILDIPNSVSRMQPFGPLLVSTTEVSADKKHDLARLVQPDVPVIMAGRSKFEFDETKPEIDAWFDGMQAADPIEVETNWVAVAAQVNLKKQEINFRVASYPEDAFLAVVKIHLQRFDIAAPWLGWQDVETYLPFLEFERPPLTKVNELRARVDLQQEVIARTKLPKRISGDRIDDFYDTVPFLKAPPPKDRNDIQKLVRDWGRLAEKAFKGDRPFDVRDPATAMVLARAVVTSKLASGRDLREAQDIFDKASRKLQRDIGGGYRVDDSAEPDKMMPIAAYDLNAVPGHTYKYRIRYEIINHYAGNAGELRNPNDASQLTLFSDWSPATREVRVEAEKQFFLTAANPRGGQARVSIWEKSRGGFNKKDVEVVIGDMIGDTGAECIDLIFNEDINGRQDTVMVYIAKDGSLRQSLLSVDREINRAFERS